MARNYGISALLLFLLASLYPKWRDRGVLLGAVAFLLANTNAHSVLLAGAFMMFWLLDLVFEQGLRWTRALKIWTLNGGIVAVGVLVCFVTIYPPFNDAAMVNRGAISLRDLAMRVLVPASSFGPLLIDPLHMLGLQSISDYPASWLRRVLSIILVGGLLGLVRCPAALIAGTVSLLAFCLFFLILQPGSYRHDGLWLSFIIVLYWMADARRRGPLEPVGRQGVRLTAGFGLLCLVGLLLLQAPPSIMALAHSWARLPESRVPDLGRLLRTRADLNDAILLPDPDFLLEALPYYARNRIYLPRAGQFAAYAKFARQGTLSLSVDGMLTTAQTLCRQFAAPTVLIFNQDLDAIAPPRAIHEGYNWTLVVTADAIRKLHSSTEFLGQFDRAVSDETFGAYVLHPPCSLTD